jgi:hypothetical protein
MTSSTANTSLEARTNSAKPSRWRVARRLIPLYNTKTAISNSLSGALESTERALNGRTMMSDYVDSVWSGGVILASLAFDVALIKGYYELGTYLSGKLN